MDIMKINSFHRIAGTLAVLVGMAAFAPAWSIPTERILYAMDSDNGNILAITPNKSVSILVSQAQITAATGGPVARFTDNGMFFDRASGKLYFTDSESDSVLVRDASGAVSVVSTAAQITAATGSSSSPEHIVLQGGALYVTDSIADSLLRIDPNTGVASVLTSEATLQTLTGDSDVDIESGIAVSPDGSTIYIANDVNDVVFAIDIATGTPSVLSTSSPFSDLDVFLTLAPNGDVIVADDITDSSGTGGDVIYRVDATTGAVSIFLSEADLVAVVGGLVDLEGGLAFDEFGNFFVAEENTDSIFRWLVDDLSAGTIDTASGELFLSQAAIIAAVGLGPNFDIDFEGGLVFGVPVPEPGSIALFGIGLVGLRLLRRRRKAS